MSPFVLLAAAFLGRVDAHGEAAYDAGLDRDLRGHILFGLGAELVRTPSLRLEIFTTARSLVRSNRADEGPVRISPQQIYYRAGAHLRLGPPDDAAWGLFAVHQSNHDIDESDAVLIRETIAYEIYGIEWLTSGLRIAGGVYYDRGTTRELEAQALPFNYYLLGVESQASTWLQPPFYAAAAIELVAHRNGSHSPGHLNISGQIDLGAALTGRGGALRVFLRLERLEDYQFLGDRPRHLLLVGTSIDTIGP